VAARLGLGTTHGTPREAATHGDAVLLGVRWADVDAALEAAGAADGVLAGKALLDPVNPVELERFTLVSGPVSAAERIQQRALGAHVVKAFNLCHVDVWRQPSLTFEGRPLGVPLCGDSDDALEVVRELARSIGCVPVDGGPLERAELLEATTAFAIGLWVAGADVRSMFPAIA
jgi:8-hydroxy-5-deazaflavin:NADPH oxidoreductase